MVQSVFIFHRDLRLIDNTALIRAFRESDKVLLAFVFPPNQIDPSKNAYFSHSAVQFMCESLAELNRHVCVHFFHEDYSTALCSIQSRYHFEKLYHNKDYSVYATQRDKDIKTWCASNGVDYIDCEDYGLFSLKEGLLPDGRPYTVLAQFYKRYIKDLQVRPVDNYAIDISKVATTRIRGQMNPAKLHILYNSNPHIAQRGGRKNAIAILQQIKQFTGYKDTRDIPALEHGTTKMSAHLKFGTVSVREMYWACVKAFKTRDHPLIRELMFREFYLKIYAIKPELQRGVAYHARLDKHIPWTNDERLWKAWTTGSTGYPLVDAGMRQLLRENWCHNRVRMLVASVATKYYLLDWRRCARFFYTQLVDADTFSNTAGWGWASSTGVDATLYFRAPFNPFIQSKKFDTNAEYIKKYVPELQSVSANHIHKWFDPAVRALYPNTTYPAPIVDHRKASAHALMVFKRAAHQA